MRTTLAGFGVGVVIAMALAAVLEGCAAEVAPPEVGPICETAVAASWDVLEADGALAELVELETTIEASGVRVTAVDGCAGPSGDLVWFPGAHEGGLACQPIKVNVCGDDARSLACDVYASERELELVCTWDGGELAGTARAVRR